MNTGNPPTPAPDLRYPIGRFSIPASVDAADIARHIETISTLPSRLRDAVAGLAGEQLDAPYRPGGWTLRQVVHHVPDSHLNAYVRMKLALTEPEPSIKPYDEAAWARLPDVPDTPLETSLALVDSLHARWVILMRGISATEWKRTYRHPEMGVLTLDVMPALYAWHGEHHTAHIARLRRSQGW